jgi:hypothetical protein
MVLALYRVSAVDRYGLRRLGTRDLVGIQDHVGRHHLRADRRLRSQFVNLESSTRLR